MKMHRLITNFAAFLVLFVIGIAVGYTAANAADSLGYSDPIVFAAFIVASEIGLGLAWLGINRLIDYTNAREYRRLCIEHGRDPDESKYNKKGAEYADTI